MIPSPPKLSDLLAGTKLKAGLGESTTIADFDFETYSPAGFVWNNETHKFDCPPGATRKGLPVTGVAVYSEHSDAEILSLAYDLKDGLGRRLWTPTMATLPHDLLTHVKKLGLLEAWNVTFEFWIWNNICVPKYGWPSLSPQQVRCASAKARAYGLPASLGEASSVMDIQNQKDKDGMRLITKFCMPRNPTKYDPRTRITLQDDPEDALNLFKYNLRDIEAEAEISSLVPDLSPFELQFWQIDQAINYRGVAMDRETIQACISIIDQARYKYNEELKTITNGFVQSASEIQKLKMWLGGHGVFTDSLDAEHLEELLKKDMFPPAHRALEIRSLIGSAAVAKLFTMNNQMSKAGRLHELFSYHSARTGRAAGRGVQPQNLPNNANESVWKCVGCLRHFKNIYGCPWCGTDLGWFEGMEWSTNIVDEVIPILRTGNLELVEMFYGDAIKTISCCIRGLFVAASNHDLMCSDYSSIEAVVLAELAGEEWQKEVFNTHGQIYEMTASKITGVPLEEFELIKATSGKHHHLRKLGKVASLASGYQGWLGAWKKFNADEFLTEEEIKSAILAWRKASPNIVEFWGGQERNWTPEYFGLEGAAIQAVLNSGVNYSHRSISYLVQRDVLFCTLPSGRHIAYHKPRLSPSERRAGTYSLSFEGYNSNPKYGAIGWVRMSTYGGKLTENVVQGVARDILANAIINLEKAGYPVVLHVHDEIVCEVPESFGSLEEFESIMSTMPEWAKDWPIKAKGGWRAKRYGK